MAKELTDQQIIDHLIDHYNKGTITEEYQDELERWYNHSESNKSYFEFRTHAKAKPTKEERIIKRKNFKKIKEMYKADTGHSLPMRRSRVILIFIIIVLLVLALLIWWASSFN